MEPAEEECGGSGSPRQGPVPQAPTLTAPGLAPVQAAWPAGAEGGGAGGGGGGKLRSPPTSSPASAGSPRHGASADKQQLLQQLLAVAAEEERQSGSPTGAPLSAGAGLTTAQQFGTLFPAAAAAPMPHLLAQQGLPFAAQPFSGQVSPTTAPGLTLAQLLQAQLAAEHAQREATPEQLEAAAGEEMVEAGQRSQQWQPEGEEEEEEEGMEGGERKAARRESNRQAAARYRQRQKEQRDQVAAQLVRAAVFEGGTGGGILACGTKPGMVCWPGRARPNSTPFCLVHAWTLCTLMAGSLTSQANALCRRRRRGRSGPSCWLSASS